jgi:HlyD family secretion protein
MNRIWLILLLLPGLACGCSRPDPPPASPISLDPAVKLVYAQPRTIVRTVEQPGVIGAYERTALYAKVSGFVEKWNVDIGDRVKKGATLVELMAPELVAQHQQMQAQVELDRALVDQSQKQHLVAQRNVTAATETVAQARADVNRYEADVERWTSEVKRLTSLVAEKVVDQQVLEETQRQLKSSQAALEASRAAVKTRDAQRLAAEATQERTRTDISAAEARVQVAIADERRLAALVGYLTIAAPYDGVVFARNVNLGDFVTPASGDPTQGVFSLGVSPSRATPLYVLNRIDPVLFVIGVPEADAAYVVSGTRARVRVPALANHEFAARVTRTSWALNSTSRTLMAQIDLPNPKANFLPGMYAYGSVIIERPGVRALPVATITQIGNQTYCYLAQDRKAVRTPVQTGVSDGSWVEVTGKLVRPAGSAEGTWKPFDGTEAVIDGDLSDISDGKSIAVGQESCPTYLLVDNSPGTPGRSTNLERSNWVCLASTTEEPSGASRRDPAVPCAGKAATAPGRRGHPPLEAGRLACRGRAFGSDREPRRDEHGEPARECGNAPGGEVIEPRLGVRVPEQKPRNLSQTASYEAAAFTPAVGRLGQMPLPRTCLRPGTGTGPRRACRPRRVSSRGLLPWAGVWQRQPVPSGA